jgi:hypothetical protein
MALRTDPKPIFLDFEGVMGFWSGETPPAAYSDFLELESIEIALPEQETVRLIGRRTSTLGQAIDSQTRVKDSVASVMIKANTFSPALQALAMGATVAETTQATSTVVDEIVTTVLNVWLPLANQGISTSGFTLETSLDVLVVASKYEVDHELGLIRAIHADAVGTDMKVGYSVADRTWEAYDGGNAANEYIHITGKATNQITKNVGTLDIWRANLSPDGPFLMPSGDKHFQASFKGDLIVPSVTIRGVTAASPWRFRDRTA